MSPFLTILRRIGVALSMVVSISVGAATASDQSQRSDTQRFEELWTLLGMTEMVSILHDEGLSMALASDMDLLGHEGGPRWKGALQAIYDEATLHGELHTQFEQHLAPDQVAALCKFYENTDMQEIIQHEIAARRAFLDLEFEQLARDRWLQGDTSDNLDDTIRHDVDLNDLIELNVMGALNSNYVFLNTLNQTLTDVTGQMSAQDILSHVWSQEVDIRTDTTEWIFAYLHTAYAPIDHTALERYVAFSATPTGQALNQALFTAFDAVYLRLSGDLGRVVGTMSREEEL